jgi:hypothetical protein
MAKAKNLAGLAALGALGYMLTRDKTSENAGDQKTSSYTGDTKKVEALEDAFIPTNESSYARNTGAPRQGVGDATSDPLPKKRIKSLAAADRDTKTFMPSGMPDSESGMSRGTRAADARSAEAGTSRGTRKTSVAGAGRGFANPASVNPSSSKDLTTSKSRLDPGGSSPSLAAMEARKAARDEEARKANMDAYRADVLGQNMESRVLKNMQDAPVPGMMKKGGVVKKMASGGMTSKVSSASKRADGIASRGKTKCKMY